MKTMLTACAVLALALSLGADAKGSFIVTDLGEGYAYGLNANGQVVG